MRLGRLAVCGVLAAALLAGGCKPKALRGEPVNLYEGQNRSRKRLAPELGPAGPAIGPETPYVPVVEPPRVQRVWLPSYVNPAGDLVSGHWVYLMLESSRWFVGEGREDAAHKALRLEVPASLTVGPPPEAGE